MVKKDKKPTTAKSNGKKTVKKAPLKEVSAPPVEIDIEFIHNLISAEVAVQLYKSRKYEVRHQWYNEWTWYACSLDVSNIIDVINDEHLKSQMKLIGINQLLKKWFIRSIISSLWLWATAMFLILNNL